MQSSRTSDSMNSQMDESQYYAIHAENEISIGQGNERAQQGSNQLLNFSSDIYLKNVMLSGICIIILIGGIFIIHMYTGLFVKTLYFPQAITTTTISKIAHFDIVCNILKTQFTQVISYLQFLQLSVADIYTRVILGQIIIDNSSTLETYIDSIDSKQSYQQIHRQNVYGQRGGLQCLFDSVESGIGCNAFLPISRIVWQYLQNPSMRNIISKIIICSHVNVQTIITGRYACAGSPITKNNNESNIVSLVSQSYQSVSLNQLKLVVRQNQYYICSYQQINITSSYHYLLILVKISLGVDTINNLVDFSSFISQGSSLNLKLILNNLHQINHQYQKSGEKSKIVLINSKQQSCQSVIGGYNQYNFQIEIQIETTYFYQSLYPFKYFLCVIPLLYLLYICLTEISKIRKTIVDLFYRKQILNKMYKLSIQQIFTAQKPTCSNILQKSETGMFFYSLSQLIDKSIAPIPIQKQEQIKKKPFQFRAKTRDLVQKYKQIVEGLMQLKNKQILNNRFTIQSFINDICEIQNKNIKEFHAKAQQLGLIEDFFRFAYSTIIKPPDKFRKFIRQDKTPMPRELISQFIRINKELHEVDILRQKIQLSINGNYPQDFNEAGIFCKQSQKTFSKKTRNHKLLSDQTGCGMKNIGLKYPSPTKINKNSNQIKIIKKKSINPNENKRVRKRNIAHIYNQGQLLALKNSYIGEKNLKQDGINNKNDIEMQHIDKIQSEQSMGDPVLFSRTQSQKFDLDEFDKHQDKKSIESEESIENSDGNIQPIEHPTRFKESQNTYHPNLGTSSQSYSSCELDSNNWLEEETRDEMEIRIRVQLIPKYLTMLKNLDFENQYARKLGLQRQLWNLSQIIQNTRYLLMKHNKNIRTFAK